MAGDPESAQAVTFNPFTIAAIFKGVYSVPSLGTSGAVGLFGSAVGFWEAGRDSVESTAWTGSPNGSFLDPSVGPKGPLQPSWLGNQHVHERGLFQ